MDMNHSIDIAHVIKRNADDIVNVNAVLHGINRQTHIVDNNAHKEYMLWKTLHQTRLQKAYSKMGLFSSF